MSVCIWVCIGVLVLVCVNIHVNETMMAVVQIKAALTYNTSGFVCF